MRNWWVWWRKFFCRTSPGAYFCGRPLSVGAVVFLPDFAGGAYSCGRPLSRWGGSFFAGLRRGLTSASGPAVHCYSLACLVLREGSALPRTPTCQRVVNPLDSLYLEFFFLFFLLFSVFSQLECFLVQLQELRRYTLLQCLLPQLLREIRP